MITNPKCILESLARSPSRASAAAIGQRFVLNGVSGNWQRKGIDLLGGMICDWTVAILDQAIHDPTRDVLTREHALSMLGVLMRRAIKRGYNGLSLMDCEHLIWQARNVLVERNHGRSNEDNSAVADLCGHLGQAIANGVFPQLTDF